MSLLTSTDLLAPRRSLGQRLHAVARSATSGPLTREAKALTVIVAALVVVGLVMSFSASVVDQAQAGNAFHILQRQLAWAGIGLPLFWLVSRVDPTMWRGLSWLMIVIAIVGLLLVLVPGIGVERGGSARWLGFGPLVAQPSEVAKLATVLWLADVITRKRDLRIDGRLSVPHLVVPAVPLVGLQVLLIMAEPDLGTAIMVGLILAILLYAEGLPMRWFVGGGVLMGVLASVGAIVAPYRLARIHGWLWPERYPTESGYQLLQSLYALGNGGLTGVGIGSSRGKWNFIPNPETDFVFAIIGEELGLIGALMVLGLFATLLVVGLRVARQAEGFSRTVAFTITGWLVCQAAINVATVIGVLPITGMTLPLISAGGSSLVSTLVALGILVAIARANGTSTDRPTKAA